MEAIEGAIEKDLELLEFPVHGQAEGKEGPGGRVPEPRSSRRRDCRDYQVGEAIGGGDGRLGPCPHQDPGDSPALSLLAQSVKEIGEFRFTQGIDEFGGRHGAPRIHPHIEGPRPDKAETPARIVHVEGRESQVKEDAVNFRNATLPKYGGKPSEAVPDKEDTAPVALKGALGPDEGMVIPIDPDQSAIRGCPLQNGAPMSAAAHRAIDIGLPRRAPEMLQGLLQEDGPMLQGQR
jgi:hypothetical protein